MQPRLMIPILFTGISAVAQESARPLITPVSKPFGNISSASIGTSGGSIVSADGNLTIKFPEGALTSETTITIQPVPNGAAASESGAYQLEPSGVRFKKPVQVVFRYSGSNENADIKSIATQDDAGLWWQARKVEIDTVTKTVSCYVPHFSKWSLFEKLVLKPKQSSIKTNTTLQLTVYEYSEDEELLEELKKKGSNNQKSYSQDADMLSPLVEIHGSSNDAGDLPALSKSPDHDLLTDLKPNYSISAWAVNGFENGNTSVGTITGKMKLSATYKAPAAVPSQNPVDVSAKVTGMSFTPAGGKKMRTLYLVAHIDIYDKGYKFTFIQVSNNFNGVFKQLDSSTCVIVIDNEKPVLKNIVNHKPWSDWPPKNKSGCQLTYPSADSWKGLTEIWGMSAGMFKPPSEKNSLSEVVVQLIPAMGNPRKLSRIVNAGGAFRGTCHCYQLLPNPGIYISLSMKMTSTSNTWEYGARMK